MKSKNYFRLHGVPLFFYWTLLMPSTTPTYYSPWYFFYNGTHLVQFRSLFTAQRNNNPTAILRSLKLKFVADVPLPGGTSRFDYQSIDGIHRRLFISHMGANLVTVFDIDSDRVVDNLSNIQSPTGILSVPVLNRVYVSSSAENKVYAIDATSFKVVQTIRTGSFPDGIAYDPELRRVFVSCEFGGVVTVFDASTNHIITNIQMGGHVGNTHFDPISHTIFSAVQTLDELVQINPKTLRIVAHYRLNDCDGPHGFYIDPQTHYAFITGEDNASYVVFDLTSKKILSSGTVGADPDVLAFDNEAHRLYVSSESGVVSVFDVDNRQIKKVGEVFFASNAHTVSVDQKTHLVFFPLQNIGGRALLRIMKPAGKATHH